MRRIAFSQAAAALVALAVVNGSTAQELSQRNSLPVMTEDGVTLPVLDGFSDEAVYSVWPAEARRLAVEGRAAMQCVIDVTGEARDCELLSESPAGMGFGLAIGQLIPLIKAQPATDRDGNPVQFSVPVNVAFRCGDLCTPLDVDNLDGPLAIRVPWERAPSLDDVMGAFPPTAAESGTRGDVTLECRFRSTGELRQCRVVAETPARQGFGQAALRLSSRFKSRAAQPLSPDLRVLIPIRFELAGARPRTGQPELAASPTRGAYLAAFPQRADQNGLTQGVAVLGCAFNESGYLVDCEAESESPAGSGFAAAAFDLAPSYRFNLWSAEGLPVIGGRVRVPFELEKAPPELAQAPRRLDQPDWERRPTAEEVSKAYPLMALRREQRGRVVLRCQIQANGSAGGCEVESESPTGFGFGNAALSITPQFRLRPPMVDGRPVMPTGAFVRIPVNFDIR